MGFLQDLRYGLRVLAANRGFAIAALLCLALGIGATTAIFSVTYAVVLKPLPFRQPDQLVRLYTEWPTWPKAPMKRFWTSPPEFDELKRELQSWQALEAWSTGGANLSGGGAAEPARITIASVTGNLIPMLGVAPVLGRSISPEDDNPGAPRVALISHGLFQRAYGSDRGVIGREIQVNGRAAKVIGVMPPEFRFPPGETDPAELWAPLQLGPPNPQRRGNHFLSLLGRLKDGTSLTQATQELDRYTRISGERASNNNHVFNPKTHTLAAYGLHDEVTGNVQRAIWMLLGAAGFLLLIACVNVANLLLARAESRQREIAVRQAIGAGSWRLLRQFIAEGILLSTAGAVLGVALAWALLRALVAAGADSIPRAAEVGLDPRVLLATLAVTLFTGIVFGIAPMAHLALRNLHDSLKNAAGRTTSGVTAALFRNAMVVSQLALALMLLIGTGLMVRAFWKLLAVDAGIDPANVLTLRVALPPTSYSDSKATTPFWNRLEERVRSLPGVQAAAIAEALPPLMQLDANDTQIENFVMKPDGPIQNIDYWTVVGNQYFEVLRLKLIEGRTFQASDGPGSNPVLVINQTMAETYWPGQSALGRRVRPGFQDPWFTVIGVVGDAKNSGLDKPSGTELYLANAQLFGTPFAQRAAYLTVRTQGDPLALAAAVRAEIRGMDPALPVSAVRTMEQVLQRTQSRPRFLTLLLSSLSAVALGLAALGVYGVISYSVARRTNEFGIRMALGAQSADVLRRVLREGLILGLIGLACGIGGAALLTRFLAELLFGVSPTDPLTFAAMAGMLFLVTGLACLAPAFRATRVDPLVALRYD